MLLLLYIKKYYARIVTKKLSSGNGYAFKIFKTAQADDARQSYPSLWSISIALKKMSFKECGDRFIIMIANNSLGGSFNSILRVGRGNGMPCRFKH